jgi:hypothetical protein
MTGSTVVDEPLRSISSAGHIEPAAKSHVDVREHRHIAGGGHSRSGTQLVRHAEQAQIRHGCQRPRIHHISYCRIQWPNTRCLVDDALDFTVRTPSIDNIDSLSPIKNAYRGRYQK